MAKFKLIQKPTFKAPVMIQRAGYSAEKVEFEFKYLDRTALADLYTGWNERHDELSKQLGDMDLKAFTAAQIALQADQLLDVVVGWDIEEKFTPENVRILVNSINSAPKAVLNAYAEAFSEARLGNS
ncbi:phage tail assembly chaperone [Pseudomonas tolaasii]|uniref:phage tail assembly chaperone n=1 Tax=Pseudomonas tolaasii TaxID=29442 RepID=UPI002734319A|nr:phage tail assembly chaperone [Pseudomonas tolaasii]WLH49745.1 phage tail assembly chaperone [Pseudomonas tolaasii]